VLASRLPGGARTADGKILGTSGQAPSSPYPDMVPIT